MKARMECEVTISNDAIPRIPWAISCCAGAMDVHQPTQHLSSEAAFSLA